jgi:hypothetical protein
VGELSLEVLSPWGGVEGGKASPGILESAVGCEVGRQILVHIFEAHVDHMYLQFLSRGCPLHAICRKS